MRPDSAEDTIDTKPKHAEDQDMVAETEAAADSENQIDPDEDWGENQPYGISPEFVRQIAGALEPGAGVPELDDALERVRGLHTADQADLLERLDEAARTVLIESLAAEFDAEVLTYLDDDVREDVIDQMGLERTAAALAELDTDDAIDIVIDLDDEAKEAILAAVPDEDRVLLEEGLAYPEDSAGRLMQRQPAAVPDRWSVGETIDYLRANDALPDDFYNLILVNAAHEPIGTVPLSRVLRSRRFVRVTDIMDEQSHDVPVDMDQEDVALMFRQYGLVEAPVINAAGRLIGTITVDDVVEVIDEEAQEDIMALAGVRGELGIYQDVVETTKARFSWLLINLGTAVAASLVIGLFEDVITAVVALAVLMPIVASMGGNAGTQTMTVAVRALAMKELHGQNALRVLKKELLVGLANGLLFAAVTGAVALAWFGDPRIGAVIGTAMIVNLMIAGIAGSAIPLGLQRLGFDPAVASAVVLTTVTDVVGFFAFLGLASLVLF